MIFYKYKYFFKWEIVSGFQASNEQNILIIPNFFT